jgi:hypothetical protein
MPESTARLHQTSLSVHDIAVIRDIHEVRAVPFALRHLPAVKSRNIKARVLQNLRQLLLIRYKPRCAAKRNWRVTPRWGEDVETVINVYKTWHDWSR